MASAMSASAPAEPTAAVRVRPTGVTVLAVIGYVIAGLLVLGGLAMFAAGSAFGAIAGEADAGWMGAIFAAGAAVFGVVILVLAAIWGVVAWGQWTGAAWAWIVTLILWGLSALSSVLNLVQGDMGSIVGLAIAGLVLWYFFQPQVQTWFGRTPKAAAAPA